MPNSLMDMFQPQDAAGQPASLGDAFTSRSNSLIGLGLGLLAPSNPLRGQSSWGQALEGFQGGAQIDARTATAAAERRQRAAEAAMSRSQHAADSARAQSNFEREFALKGAGTYTKIGEDSVTGQPQYGFVNPRTQEVTPYKPPTEQDPGAAVAGREATVDAILQGRMAPPTSFAASKPYWQGILSQAATKEPGFDLTQWGARYGTAKDFASGQARKNITSLDTVTGHLETLMDKANALDNYRFPSVNEAKNYIGVQAGKPQVTEFNLARNAVADELAKVFRSSGMSESEIRRWQVELSAAGSPDQLRGGIRTAIDLLDSRRDALKQQYRSTMGRDPPDFLSEKGQKALDRVRNWSDTGKDQAAPAAATGAAPPQSTSAPTAGRGGSAPQRPANVPQGSYYSPSRNQWKLPDGTIVDAAGRPI